MPALINGLLLLFIVLQGIITLFSLITLPVEIDASKRALAWLSTSGITYGREDADARDALKWAAYTYVVNALSSVAMLVYYIWRFTGNNSD
jgi:Zn-dependent membrane protease YugP